MSTVGELACVYASLILNDDGIPITADKISTLVKAANVDVEAYWPGLFAKLAEKKNITDLISNIGSGGGGGGVAAAPVAVAAGSGGGGAAAVEKEKEKEIEEESDEDMGIGLFDED